MTAPRDTPEANTLRRLHASGMSLAEAAAVLGINKEAVRGRARRAGISWVGRDEMFSPFDEMSEGQRVASVRTADRRLRAALAAAFLRGEHLPAAHRRAA